MRKWNMQIMLAAMSLLLLACSGAGSPLEPEKMAQLGTAAPTPNPTVATALATPPISPLSVNLHSKTTQTPASTQMPPADPSRTATVCDLEADKEVALARAREAQRTGQDTGQFERQVQALNAQIIDVRGGTQGNVECNTGGLPNEASTNRTAALPAKHTPSAAPKHPPTFPATPTPFDPFRADKERQLALSATEAGRAIVYGGYLAYHNRDQSDIAWGRLDCYQNIFTMRRGLGDFPNETTFKEFLKSSYNPGCPDPEYYQRQLERVADLMDGPTPTDKDVARYRADLAADGLEQINLIIGGMDVYGIMRERRERVERYARGDLLRAWEVAALRRALGKPDVANPFVEAVAQGKMFVGPDQENYRAAVGQAADLLSGSAEGLSPDAKKFREELMADPERQYEMAYQVTIMDVAPAFRDGARSLLRRRFDALMWTAAADEHFLVHYMERGFYGGS